MFLKDISRLLCGILKTSVWSEEETQISMGEGEEQMVQATSLMPHNGRHAKEENKWVIMEDDDDNDDSISSIGSTSSLDVIDDASSPTSWSSSNSNGPLFELSELMAHLPLKRGLSNFYEGKSQSFTSLSRVTSIEDLAKKETPYRRKMKYSKSYGDGFDAHKPYTLPKAIIAKRVSRGSMSCLPFPGTRSSFLNCTRPPPIPVQKKL
uniref:Uncharacterized protein MANES_04G135000 n=2 Tax=Rhizophora mucronata TaxID=61149 RepID=A0A2P2IKU0_RHIMU